MNLLKKWQFILLFAIGGSVLSIAKTTQGDDGGVCVVPIGLKPNLIYQWPLVFKANGELYPSIVNRELGERQMKVANNIEVILSCGPNYLKNYNRTEELKVKCNGATGNFIIISDKEEKAAEEVNIKNLTCFLRVIEEVVVPIGGCTNGVKWTGVKFGYVDPKEKLSYILGEACYDMTEGRTLFAHVKLGDKAVNYLEKQEKNFLTKEHPDGRYKAELFRGLHFDEIYERIRQELHTKNTPSLKMSNYVDNALLSNAQFQPIRKLSWNYYVSYDDMHVLDTLKHDIKKLSEKLVVDIYVGSHGVKELYGENGEKIMLYLHHGTRDRFPMPALIWFIVKQHEKATVFVVFNEATNDVNNLPPTSSNICRSDCSKVTWLRQTLKDNVNRLLCCSYDDFKNTMKEMPIWTDVKEMLL